MFHVENGAGKKPKGVFQQTKTMLNDHGIGTERISHNSSWGLSVPRSILGQIKKGSYAAVALGMRGLEQGVLRDLNLAGGTTLKRISKIEKTALWCCP